MQAEERAHPGDGAEAGALEARGHAAAELAADFIEAIERLLVQEPHRGETRGHRHWIGVERSAVRDERLAAARIEHRHHLGAPADRADGKPATDDLAQARQVRADVEEALGAVVAEPEA